ncbi:FAD-dependent thymidylate synthase [Thermovibrio sp.]
MVKLISQTENLTKVIATAARVCYSGLPLKELLSRYSREEDEELIKRVVGMGHLSVVEHGVLTFKVSRELKEELFKITVDKPFLKITDKEDGFIVSINLRTAIELLNEKPNLRFVKEVSKFIPEFLKPRS